MEKNNEDQFILTKEEIENNKQELKAEMKDVKENIKDIKETLRTFATFMTDQTNISKYSPAQKDTLTPPDPTTTVQTNRRAPPLEGEISDKFGGMWTLKH